MTDERTNKEISAAIAKRLWPGSTKDGHEWRFGKSWVDWSDFASDHNAALGLIVPEMRKRGWFFLVDDYRGELGRTTFVRFSKQGAPVFEPVHGEAYAEFDELPRAICLAAEAVMDAEGAQG